DPRDINSFLPLHETTLESDPIKLIPFIPPLHVKQYAAQATAHPELHLYFPIDLSNLDRILTTVEPLMCSFPMPILLPIIDEEPPRRARGHDRACQRVASILEIEIAGAVLC
ncbi:hypothetical protein BJV74DRAFT_762923, partial [Russula compacta]